jgi:hypothetical protein
LAGVICEGAVSAAEVVAVHHPVLRLSRIEQTFVADGGLALVERYGKREHDLTQAVRRIVIDLSA